MRAQRSMLLALTAAALALSALPVLPSAQAVPTVPAVPVVDRAAAPTVLPASWTPVPSYDAAKVDEPITYSNGCHAGKLVTVPKPCTTVNADRPRTVMILGDSHAAHWHAAVLSASKASSWRMRTMTKSGCPAVSVTVRRYKTSYPYVECSTWRSRALSGLAARSFGRVDVLVISSWHFHTVVDSLSGNRTVWGDEKTTLWRSGMRKTLATVLKGVKQVVILRDSPDLPGDRVQAQTCFATYGLDAQTKCGGTLSSTTRSAIWRAEREAAAYFPGRVVTLDLTTATCPGSWCGPIDDPYLRFKDDNHWTQTYVRAHFSAPVTEALVAAMQRAVVTTL